MNSLKTVTPPSIPPVSTDAMFSHERANDTAEATNVEGFVRSVTDLYTRRTGHVPTTTTFRLSLDGWPCGGVVYIPRYPVASVTSMQYLDADGSWQTLAGTSTDLDSLPARVILPTSRPTLHATQLPKIKVTFVAGNVSALEFATAYPLAEQGIRLAAGHYVEHREAYEDGDMKALPNGFDTIVNCHKIGCITDWNTEES